MDRASARYGLAVSAWICTGDAGSQQAMQGAPRAAIRAHPEELVKVYKLVRRCELAARCGGSCTGDQPCIGTEGTLSRFVGL